MTRSLLRNDIMRFSVLGFISDIRIEIQAPALRPQIVKNSMQANRKRRHPSLRYSSPKPIDPSPLQLSQTIFLSQSQQSNFDAYLVFFVISLTSASVGSMN